MAYGGTSLRIIDHAHITAPFPIVTHGRIITRAPIQTPCHILISHPV